MKHLSKTVLQALALLVAMLFFANLVAEARAEAADAGLRGVTVHEPSAEWIKQRDKWHRCIRSGYGELTKFVAGAGNSYEAQIAEAKRQLDALSLRCRPLMPPISEIMTLRD